MASFNAEDGVGRAAGRATLIKDIVHCFRSCEFHRPISLTSTGPTAQTALLLKQLARYHEAHANMVNFSTATAEKNASKRRAEPAKQQPMAGPTLSRMPLIRRAKS